MSIWLWFYLGIRNFVEIRIDSLRLWKLDPILQVSVTSAPILPTVRVRAEAADGVEEANVTGLLFYLFLNGIQQMWAQENWKEEKTHKTKIPTQTKAGKLKSRGGREEK